MRLLVQDAAGQTVAVPVTVHPKPAGTIPQLVVLPGAADVYSTITSSLISKAAANAASTSSGTPAAR